MTGRPERVSDVFRDANDATLEQEQRNASSGSTAAAVVVPIVAPPCGRRGWQGPLVQQQWTVRGAIRE